MKIRIRTMILQDSLLMFVVRFFFSTSLLFFLSLSRARSLFLPLFSNVIGYGDTFFLIGPTGAYRSSKKKYPRNILNKFLLKLTKSTEHRHIESTVFFYGNNDRIRVE